MIFDALDVVVVPFPFTDSALVVRRPALVLSRLGFNGHGRTVMAMITDQRNDSWPLDTPIDYQSVGLKMPSMIRMKFFTLDNRLIAGKIGHLPSADRRKLLQNLQQLLPPFDDRDLEPKRARGR